MTAEHIRILQLFADGHTAKAIGEKLGLSARTIEKHIEYLKFECDARNITNLITINLRNKVIK